MRCLATAARTAYSAERRCAKLTPRRARLCAHHLSMPAERVRIWSEEQRKPVIASSRNYQSLPMITKRV